MEYNPERYLKDGILNPDMNTNSAVFGFGRRLVNPAYSTTYLINHLS